MGLYQTCERVLQLQVNVFVISAILNFSGNTTVDELMMRLMGAMEIFTAQQLEDIKDEVRFVCIKNGNIKHVFNYFENWSMTVLCMLEVVCIGIFLWRVSVIKAMLVSLRAEVLGQLDSSKTSCLLPA